MNSDEFWQLYKKRWPYGGPSISPPCGKTFYRRFVKKIFPKLMFTRCGCTDCQLKELQEFFKR